MKAHALFALCACLAAAASADVEIALRSKVELGSGVVRVGDVAVLRSPDLQLLRAIVDLPLGRAPSPGERVLVQQAALASWIRARTGVEAGSLHWSGPERTEVATGQTIVRAEDIAAAAETALRDRLQPQAVRAQVELQALPRDVVAPPGALRLVARPLEGAALRSRMLVWVEVWSADRFVRAAAVPFHVAAWREVPVAARALAADEPVRQEEITQAAVDVAAQPGLIALPPGPAGLRMRRAVPVGAALRASDIEDTPAVQRGQWASLRSGEGAVLTQARVEVLQDGRIGQQVRVRPSGAATALFARVTGPGQLEVAR